jgi:toxin ParE1/3/4
MKRYRLDADARRDLVDIHKYIARDNRGAADRMMQEIKQKLRLLASQPTMGQQRPELANLRSFSVGNYVILYRIAQQGIEVARVLHAARDIGAQF